MAEKRLTKGQCRGCSEVNDADRLFCDGCGEKLIEPCVECEAEIGVWERFCGKCGANVADHIKARQQEYQAVFEWVDALCGESRSREALPDAVSEIDWLADHWFKLRVCMSETDKLLELDHPLFVKEAEQLRQVKKLLRETIRRLETERADELATLPKRLVPIRLTKKIAERFLADDEAAFADMTYLDLVRSAEASATFLNTFTELDADAAESLSKHEGEYLSLNGLTSLSDAAAESLSKHKSEWLSLDGLTELSDAAAESLSKYKGELDLGGLTSLSDAVVESLSKHEGWLSLNGLTSLPDETAQILSRLEGYLFLGGLTNLSDTAAESLGKHQGGVNLNGLTSLSDAAAESLAKHEGGLYLDGLTSLSDAAAESLSKYEGSLSLDGLTSLSDAAAESLAKHEGGLSLDLDELPESAAEILRQHHSFQDDDDDDWDDDDE